MKKRLITLILLSVAAVIVFYAFFFSHHFLHSLADDSSKAISSSEFNETATLDGFMLKNNKLHDVYSLTPEILQEKDCKT